MQKAGLYQTVYLARRDESLAIQAEIDALERALSHNHPTRPIADAYASPTPISPNKPHVIVMGLICGAAVGLGIALGRKALVIARAGSRRRPLRAH
jgi:uncharacterized protein involved in exopolysaccharide biosynthesis